MIRQYGVRLLFTIAQVIGLALVIWATAAVTNRRRDRDEKQNVGAKELRIIHERTVDRDYWRHKCEVAERLADDRLGAMRAGLAAISRGAENFQGAVGSKK